MLSSVQSLTVSASGSSVYSGSLVEKGEAREVEDSLAVEAPLQIRVNETPFIITMRTPGHDVELAAGLLFSEGIITEEGLRNAQLTSSSEETLEIVTLTVPKIFVCKDLKPSRAVISYASCGICGSEELQDLVGEPLGVTRPFDVRHLPRLYRLLQDRQKAFEQTGGTHAAGVFSFDGDLLSCHEDVGRHNAVDKCVGELIVQNRLQEAGVLLVSGRLSFEIMVKAYQAGLPVVAAISAPSSLAVDMGRAFGMAVLGFCREERLTVYSHPEHLLLENETHV